MTCKEIALAVAAHMNECTCKRSFLGCRLGSIWDGAKSWGIASDQELIDLLQDDGWSPTNDAIKEWPKK